MSDPTEQTKPQAYLNIKDEQGRQVSIKMMDAAEVDALISQFNERQPIDKFSHGVVAKTRENET